MTARERLSLALLGVGVLAVAVAAFGYGGWKAAVAVVGVLAIGAGILFGLGDPTPAVAPAADGDPQLDGDRYDGEYSA